MKSTVNPAILAVCKEVDTQLNNNVHTLRRSNTHHLAKVHSRSVIAAATKIRANAKKLRMRISDYVTVAIDDALIHKKQLNIGSIASATVRKQFVKKATKATYHSTADFPTMDPSLPDAEVLGAMIAARTELDPTTLTSNPAIQQGLREGLISFDNLPKKST